MTIAATLFLCASALGLPQDDGLEMKPHYSHAVANGIVGDWVLDKELTQRLNRGEWGPPPRLSFTVDPGVLERLPERFDLLWGEDRIYVAGEMDLAGQPQPYVVLSKNGIPKLVSVLLKEDDTVGTTTTRNVTIAQGSTWDDDVLFLSGPKNHFGHAAFVRTSARADKPGFRTASEAVEFVSRCLDRADPISLRSACLQPERSPFGFQDRFTKLRGYHTEKPFPQRYASRRFPETEDKLVLGGHARELGHLHVVFVRDGTVWRLEQIFECR